jgi:ATP-dependent Clp protease protease subunit
MPLDISRSRQKPANKRLATPAPRIRAALQSDAALELLFYEPIGDDGWGGGITAKAIKSEIDQHAGRFNSIRALINSPGGDAFEGLTLAALLRAEAAKGKAVDCYVQGVSASAATIVMCAADTITLFPSSLVMIHCAQALSMGDHTAHEEIAAVLRKVDSSIVQAYARTKQPEAQLVKWMGAETWFSAPEALAAGFCDRIVEQPAEQSAAAMAAARLFKYRNVRHVPPQLRSAESAETETCQCDCASCTAGDCTTCTNVECEDPNCEQCPCQETRDGLGGTENANTGAAYEALHKAHQFMTRHGIRP